MMQQLMETRKQWHQSFLQADIESLQAIESDSFKAISAFGIVNTQTRYIAIKERKSQGKWFKHSAVAIDINIDFNEIDVGCIVTGLGEIKANENVIRKVYFSELWSFTAKGWQIQHLHTSNAM
jgi:hypothetical protein